MLSVGWLFLGNTAYGPGFLVSVFVAGVCSTTFYGWLPLYLPELFQTSVRASGQGFAFNFGRMLAAVAILQAGGIMALFRGSNLVVAGITLPEGYPAACLTMSLVYVFGMFVIWLAPETQGKPLPE